MMHRPFFATLALLGLGALAQPSCCPYDGDGTVFLNGLAVVNAFPSMSGGSLASVENATLILDPKLRAVAVLVNATSKGAEGSGAGWVITQNSTAQTLSFWYNVTAPTGIVCYRTSVALPDYFVPGFSACTGDNTGTFPHYVRSYSPAPGRLAVESWADRTGVGAAQSVMSYEVTGSSCDPISLLASSSPLGGGAWSVEVHSGSANSAPAGWLTPPAACKF